MLHVIPSCNRSAIFCCVQHIVKRCFLDVLNGADRIKNISDTEMKYTEEIYRKRYKILEFEKYEGN